MPDTAYDPTAFLPGFSVPDFKKPAAKPAAPAVDPYDLLTPTQKKQVDLTLNPRGTLSEIGTGLIHGATYELPRLIGQGLKATGQPGDTLYDAGQAVNDATAGNDVRFMADENPDSHNIVTRSIAQGANMLAPSLAPLALMAAAPITGGATVPLAGAAGAALFGGAQYQDTYEKAIKAGKSKEEAHQLGLETGAIEGLGEGAGAAVGGMLLKGVGNIGRRILGRTFGADEAITAIRNPSFFKTYAKDIAATGAVETGTEIGQNAGEAAVEQHAGIDTTTPWDAAVASIGPTLALTGLLGIPGAHALKKTQNRNKALIDSLDNLSTDIGTASAASREIATQIEPLVGKEATMKWRLDALQAHNAAAVDKVNNDNETALNSDLTAEVATHADLLDPAQPEAAAQPTTGRFKGMRQFSQEEGATNLYPGGPVQAEMQWQKMLSDRDAAEQATHEGSVRAQQASAALNSTLPNVPLLEDKREPIAPVDTKALAKAQGIQDAWEQFGAAAKEKATRAAAVTEGFKSTAEAAGIGVSPKELRGENAVRVNNALRNAAEAKTPEAAVEVLTTARDKLAKDTVGRDSLSAYIDSLEKTNGESVQGNAQNEEGSKASDASKAGGESAVRAGEGVSVPEGESQVAPAVATEEAAPVAAKEDVAAASEEDSRYHFQEAMYSEKAAQGGLNNRLWTQSYQDALNDANMVDATGVPLRKTEKTLEAQRYAKQALASLEQSEPEGAGIHAVAKVRVARLRAASAVGNKVRATTSAIAAATRQQVRDEVATEALRRNGRPVSAASVAAYKLTKADHKTIAERYGITVNEDPRQDAFAGDAAAYAADPQLMNVLDKGNLKDTLDYLAQNGPTEWARYMADFLNGLGLSTTIKMVPETKRLATKKGRSAAAVGPRMFGSYGHDTNDVQIYNGGENAHTVIHETTHAATVGRILAGVEAAKVPMGQRTAEQRAAVADVKAMHDFMLELRAKDTKGLYGFTNIKEFVAELFSNEEFQGWVNAQEHDGRNMWQKFVDLIRSVLGMRPIPQSYSTLEKALTLGFKFFEGSRFGTGTRMSFAHSATEAAQSTNATVEGLVSLWDKAQQKATPLANLGTRIREGFLAAYTTHHISRSLGKELAGMQPGVQARMAADRMKTVVLEAKHRELITVPKQLERALAKLGLRAQDAMHAKVAKLAFEQSRFNVDFNKNFDQNLALNPKLDTGLRSTINNFHAEYMGMEPQFRHAIEDSVRVFRKNYVQTTATLLAARVRAYRAQLGEAETSAHLKALDFMDPTLNEGANSNPELHYDAASANLDARLKATLVKLAANNPNKPVEQGGTTLGLEVAEIAKMYAQQFANPYQHLGRSGEFFVSLKVAPENYAAVQAALSKSGKVLGAQLGGNRNVFMRFENKAQADAAHEALKSLADPDTLTKGSVSNTTVERMQGIPHFVAAIMRDIDNQDFGPGVTDEMRSFLKRTAMEMSPDTSVQRVLAQRNEGGTPGYDADFLRNYSKRAEGMASMLANMYTLPMHDAAAAAMREEVKALESGEHGVAAKAVYNELQQRFANTLNPVDAPTVDFVKAFGYNFYLALSPAFWLTNLAQPYHLTLPWLGGRHGFVPSFNEMRKSTAKAVSVLTETLKQGVSEGNKAGGAKGAALGLLDLDFVLDKSGLRPDEIEFIKALRASGGLSSLQSVELGQLAAGASRAKATTMKLLSAGSQYTEVVNRLTAGLAGYNLEKARTDQAKATTYGILAVDETQFGYSDRNTGRAWGRHGVAGKVTPLLTSFMNYNFQTIELLLRLAKTAAFKGEAKADRIAAGKALGGIMVTTSLLAGTMGLPLANVFAAIADAVLGDDDDPSDVKTAYRAWLAEWAGKDVAEAIARGVPRAALGFDFSGRAGLQDILPGSRFLTDRRELKDKLQDGALNMLGPAVSAGKDMTVGLSHIMDGRVLDGLTEALPLALRGVAKSVQLGTQGYTNATGNQLPLEVTPWDQVVQAVGFTPSKKAEQSEVNFAFKQSDSLLNATKSKLSNKYYRAVEQGGDTAEVLQEIADFNTKNPAYKITPAHALAARAKARGVAEVSGVDIATLPRFLPQLERYKFANTQ